MKYTTLLTLAIGSLAAAAAVDSSPNIVERSCVSDCIAEGRPPTLCASLCSKRTVDVDVEVQKRESCFEECIASGKPAALCASTCS
ncbi:hypothetical protein VP1G_11138 [Cytospora mali]|uniref:Uncharacterized protein n=1 Tax=Cytospora mali TaxID=578113 RepID=A0A194V6X8_CYTMA|nr:hypothetical protein VP1G_11138 [Valsa mali var. pyri (nom. inval.)]